MDLVTMRRQLHARTLEHLRKDEYGEAARGIRRLLMMLPPQHDARPDLLHVLAYAEEQRG